MSHKLQHGWSLSYLLSPLSRFDNVNPIRRIFTPTYKCVEDAFKQIKLLLDILL